jgi:hypothetical protein
MNTGLIIQQCWSSNDFADAHRLTYQRHASYARAFKFDYWNIVGDIHPEQNVHGGWSKIWLLKWALERGYEFIAWIDSDAAIVNGQVDLRTIFAEGGDPNSGLIGAVEHNAPWFKDNGMEAHHNIGVMYFRTGPLVVEFIDDWLSRYPGEPRWAEQGSFNKMIVEEKYKDIFVSCPAKWNSTVNVNLVPDAIVMGWHGIYPVAKRLEMMKNTFKDDWFKFRV